MKRSNESQDEVFKCTVCGAQAKNEYALAAHVIRNHKTDPQKFPCDVCGKGFKTKQTLTEHMASHTGTKLYQCCFCDQMFNSSANKYKHQKFRHPDEWEEMRRTRELNKMGS